LAAKLVRTRISQSVYPFAACIFIYKALKTSLVSTIIYERLLARVQGVFTHTHMHQVQCEWTFNNHHDRWYAITILQ